MALRDKRMLVVMSGSAAQKLGFHPPVFMQVFDVHIKTPEWKHRKFEKKKEKIQTFLCLMEVEKHIDKEQIKIGAMETDLADKKWDLEVLWQQGSNSGARNTRKCINKPTFLVFFPFSWRFVSHIGLCFSWSGFGWFNDLLCSHNSSHTWWRTHLCFISTDTWFKPGLSLQSSPVHCEPLCVTNLGILFVSDLSTFLPLLLTCHNDQRRPGASSVCKIHSPALDCKTHLSSHLMDSLDLYKWLKGGSFATLLLSEFEHQTLFNDCLSLIVSFWKQQLFYKET